MYERSLRKGTSTRRFTIQIAGDLGWEVRDERDSRVVRRVLYTDWHRVERAVASFSREAADLVDEGWAVG